MMNLPQTTPDFEALLDYLKQNRGCDLTGYKRSTLVRRFGHRMRSLHIDSYQEYLQFLQRNSDEYLVLLQDVFISVTSFFRDADAWAALATEVIPQIIASKSADEPIRVWSAGCATGQEIYSCLMLLAEALGIEACLQRVQCYATDADEVVLKQARRGVYSDAAIASVPPDLVQTYFQRTEQGFLFHSQLRRTIVFGCHDVTRDAPISKIDLLICRNLLIYLNRETQAAVLVRFHFAVKNLGFLFLGQAEILMNRKEIFTPINLKQRLYTKGEDLTLEDHLSIASRSRKQKGNDFWQAVFESSPIVQFIVDLKGYLVAATKPAQRLFELTVENWNRSFLELAPGILVGAHAVTNTFYRSYQCQFLRDVKWRTNAGVQCFEVTIAPILNAQNQLFGVIITFLETTS